MRASSEVGHPGEVGVGERDVDGGGTGRVDGDGEKSGKCQKRQNGVWITPHVRGYDEGRTGSEEGSCNSSGSYRKIYNYQIKGKRLNKARI